MSMSRWDPFQDLLSFRDELNQTLNRWFRSEERQERTAAARRWTPVLDVVESKDAYRIDLEVPGVRPEDIEVTIDQGMLTIQGERRSEQETRDRRYHRIERRYGAFRRSITLPANVDTDRIQADYDNGVLRLTAPKTEAAQPRHIAVQPRAEVGPAQSVPITGATERGAASAAGAEPPSQASEASRTSQAEGERQVP
jgi:HSP20 family protein